MKDPIINYKPEIDTYTKQIIDDYWGNEKGKFGITAKNLLLKYGFTVTELGVIIKDNSSYETFYPECVDCKVQSSKIAYLRKNIPFILFTPGYRCNACLNNYNIEKEELKRQQFQNEMKLKLEKGIDGKKWTYLSSIELETLQQIVKYKDKNEIIKIAFNKNFYDKSVWKIVNRLENLWLVIVERTYRNAVICFHFDDRLENLISQDNPGISTTNDVFSFSLCKKSVITKAEDPEFSGTFILPEDIFLKKGIKYIYAGWRNSDGSISFKFTPVNKINKKPIQGSIDDDPQAIGDILKMNNNFNKDDDVKGSDKDDDSDDDNWNDEDYFEYA